MASDSRNSSILLWGITAALVVAVILFFAYQWFVATSNEPLPEHQKVAATAQPAAASTTAASEPLPEVSATESTPLVEDNILQTAVPENATLAEEEVARLNDIQSQLKDQEILLKQQHTDADELIKLKEEQVKLLEAQLAQN